MEGLARGERRVMVPFIDLHCDTLTQASLHFHDDLFSLPFTALDVKRLGNGGAKAQAFAVCLPQESTVKKLGLLYEGDWKHIKRLAGILYNTARMHPNEIGILEKAEDLDKNWSEGRISAILTVEDGREIQGDLRMIHRYFRLGVRILTLTWNNENCFGYPNSMDPEIMGKGLTEFGREGVRYMNKIGMIVDVSHLSDGGFWDVAAMSRESHKPFIASHSNCRALCDHPRNLSDEMIREIGETGGVIGMNQYPLFLNEGESRRGGFCLIPRGLRKRFEKNSLDEMVDHLRHMVEIGGIDCAALGSDFDGMGGKLCLKGPQDYQKLADRLSEEFSSEEVEKIFHGNIERVMRETLP